MPDLENLLNVEDEVTQIISDLGIPEKLNEMDDFMNQNDLKVQITNENATVTGLVTYTCTVKDKNNTALPNRVVEWYKGTTLLGMDATDSNGISTFKHHVSEADIYDVHAIVRGTHAGDDIRMFVKDKNNLLSHNLFSGGEYSNNTNGMSIVNGDISVSSDKSSIGLTSFYIKRTLSGNCYASFSPTVTTDDIGKTITLHCKVFTPNNQMKIQIQDNNYEGTTIDANDSFQLVTVSRTIASTNVKCLFNIQANTDGYIDDLEITIQ